jgi:hypothetical protein
VPPRSRRQAGCPDVSGDAPRAVRPPVHGGRAISNGCYDFVSSVSVATSALTPAAGSLVARGTSRSEVRRSLSLAEPAPAPLGGTHGISPIPWEHQGARSRRASARTMFSSSCQHGSIRGVAQAAFPDISPRSARSGSHPFLRRSLPPRFPCRRDDVRSPLRASTHRVLPRPPRPCDVPVPGTGRW